MAKMRVLEKPSELQRVAEQARVTAQRWKSAQKRGFSDLSMGVQILDWLMELTSRSYRRQDGSDSPGYG
jgi:hypothetical protein